MQAGIFKMDAVLRQARQESKEFLKILKDDLEFDGELIIVVGTAVFIDELIVFDLNPNFIWQMRKSEALGLNPVGEIHF